VLQIAVKQLIDKFGRHSTALMAQINDTVVELLQPSIALGASPDRIRSLHIATGAKANWLIPVLVGVGASVNHADANGNTALHVAAAGMNMEAVQLLLHAGADKTLRSKDGSTAHSVLVRFKRSMTDFLNTMGMSFGQRPESAEVEEMLILLA
jgi:ankyrin repeat protein